LGQIKKYVITGYTLTLKNHVKIHLLLAKMPFLKLCPENASKVHWRKVEEKLTFLLLSHIIAETSGAL